MKISYYIPKDKQNYRKFIGSELSYAPKIKNSNDRKSITQGLKKIKRNITDGKAYFWDGKELFVVDYHGKSGRYYCGKDFDLSLLRIGKKSRYLLVVMDADDCIIGELRGKRIVKFWEEKSNVPRKHNQGGQSAARFQRARAEILKRWYKKIAEKVRIYAKKEMEVE